MTTDRLPGSRRDGARPFLLSCLSYCRDKRPSPLSLSGDLSKFSESFLSTFRPLFNLFSKPLYPKRPSPSINVSLCLSPCEFAVRQPIPCLRHFHIFHKVCFQNAYLNEGNQIWPLAPRLPLDWLRRNAKRISSNPEQIENCDHLHSTP